MRDDDPARSTACNTQRCSVAHDPHPQGRIRLKVPQQTGAKTVVTLGRCGLSPYSILRLAPPRGSCTCPSGYTSEGLERERPAPVNANGEARSPTRSAGLIYAELKVRVQRRRPINRVPEQAQRSFTTRPLQLIGPEVRKRIVRCELWSNRGKGGARSARGMQPVDGQ